MKKLLILIVMLVWAGNVHAIKLCGKPSNHPWNSNTSFSSAATYTCSPVCGATSSSADATWTVTITNGLGRSGSISGQSRCSANNSTNPPVADTSNGGYYCWCRVTNIVDSTNNKTCATAGPWVFFGVSNPQGGGCWRFCAQYCASYCARDGAATYHDCSRSALFTIPACSWLGSSSAPIISAVTCPIDGTCENPDYKTIADNASCGDGYVETTSPALTISGTYSDSKGSFTYTTCTAN